MRQYDCETGGFYSAPSTRGIFNFLLKTLETDRAEDCCWVRNPIDLLSVLPKQIPVPDEGDMNAGRVGSIGSRDLSDE